MTLDNWKRARELGASFDALLMAAFVEADSSDQLEKLKAAFPEVYEEVYVRYMAPGGLLLGERDPQTGLQRTAEGLIDDDGALVVPH